MTGLARDTRAAVYVEHLIAFLPVLFFGLASWQLIELFSAELLLRRSASAAARAAAVILPDDPRFYGGVAVDDFSGARKEDVELAAALVLAGSPHFQSKPRVTLDGIGREQALTATVTASFYCFAGWVSLVCGGNSRSLTASATYPYQGASFVY